MMRCIEQLLKGERTVVGNHRCESYTNNGHEFEKYIYFSTAICTVNHTQKTFIMNKGGWDTPSTNRAISQYRYHFKNLGYSEVFDNDYELFDHIMNKGMKMTENVFYSDLEYPRYAISFRKDIDPTGQKFITIAISEIEVKEKCSRVELKDIVTEVKDVFTENYKGPKTLRKILEDRINLYD